jgi:ABC-2 type transport system permease protein
MNALHIALKDIQIFVKERGNIVYMFLMPLVFILVLSLTMQGWQTEDEDKAVPLPIVNLDPGGETSQALIEALEAEHSLQVELYAQDEALALLEDFKLQQVLIIPENFSQDVANETHVTLRLINHPDTDDTRAQSVQRVINGAAQGMSLQAQLLAALTNMGDMQGMWPEEFQVFTPERNVAQAQSQFERSKTAPLVRVEQTHPQALSQAEEDVGIVEQTIPGFTILFVFVTAQATAFSIYNEKKVGTFRRLLAAPLSKAELLAGKIIPNYVTSLIQIIVIFAVSVFILPLLGLERMKLGNDPLALALVSLLLPLCSAGLGICLAAIARTEAQIGGLSTLAVWMMGAVGGCLFPSFLLGGALDTVGKIVPHHWAIRAYQDLIVRGQGLSDVTPEMLALLGFTALFFAIGLWRFEFD